MKKLFAFTLTLTLILGLAITCKGQAPINKPAVTGSYETVTAPVCPPIVSYRWVRTLADRNEYIITLTKVLDWTSQNYITIEVNGRDGQPIRQPLWLGVAKCADHVQIAQSPDDGHLALWYHDCDTGETVTIEIK